MMQLCIVFGFVKAYSEADHTYMGCCYKMGYGKHMESCCHRQHPVMEQGVNGMVPANICPVDLGGYVGGATLFKRDISCNALFKLNRWQSNSTDIEKEFGCCYDYGKSFLVFECCQRENSVMSLGTEGMIDKQMCPLSGGIFGGGTKFIEGNSCAELFAFKHWQNAPHVDFIGSVINGSLEGSFADNQSGIMDYAIINLPPIANDSQSETDDGNGSYSR